MRRPAVIAAALAATVSGCGATTSTATEETSPEANIYVVASQSFCAATGIDDTFTGDGHVVFFLAFRNSGDADGTIDATPVRHYDDGEENASAMDMVSVDVPAGQTTKVHTTAMTYKAHSHDIVDCGVDVVGQDEVPIAVR